MVWNARLQPAAEYPIEQMETETSQSPTGTVQSFSPTWEILQVTSNIFKRIYFMSLCFFQSTASIVHYVSRTNNGINNVGNNGPAIIHGCQMGTMPATFPNDIERRSAVAVRTILDAIVSFTLGAMVRFLGHHRAPRGWTSARQTPYRRQPDESRTRSDSGLSILFLIYSKS